MGTDGGGEDDSGEVIWLSGQLDAAMVFALRDAIDRRIASGQRALRFDVSGLELIDSAGFALLVGAHNRVRRIGGHVSVSGASDNIRRVFQLAGLAWLLEGDESAG